MVADSAAFHRGDLTVEKCQVHPLGMAGDRAGFASAIGFEIAGTNPLTPTFIHNGRMTSLLSSKYNSAASMICFSLLTKLMALVLALALVVDKTGRGTVAGMAMAAVTTSNLIKGKARCLNEAGGHNLFLPEPKTGS